MQNGLMLIKIISIIFLVIPVFANEEYKIKTFYTASKTGNYYKMIRECSEYDDMRILESKGSLENFKILKNKKYVYIIAQYDVLDILSETKELKLDKENHSFLMDGDVFYFDKLLSYKENLIFITKKENLHKRVNLKSLSGKTLAIGSIGSGTYITGSVLGLALWKQNAQINIIYYKNLKDAFELLYKNKADIILSVQKLTNELKNSIYNAGFVIMTFKKENVIEYLMDKEGIYFTNPIIIYKKDTRDHVLSSIIECSKKSFK